MEARDAVDAAAAGPANGRVHTGSAQADQILGGGFLANSINLVMGQPGTGKTIFIEQLMFANAHGDRPVLYFTTLSEPLAKVVRFLQDFGFYDENKLGTLVVYDDIGRELVEHGIGALLPRLREAVKTLSPRIIVIDSFRALHDLAPSAAEMRRLIHELTGLLTAYDATVFLVGEYLEEDLAHYPEFAVSDAVVELTRRRFGTRDERYFHVIKLRGSAYLQGAHAFRITPDGLQIYPRLVTPPFPPDYVWSRERMSSGVAELDTMLGGGLWCGSSTLLGGPSGSGKTTLGLHFALDGARRGEPALFVNFQENPTQLARTIAGIDDLRARAPDRMLDLMYCSPVELQIDSIIVELFRRIGENGVTRLVLDAVGDLALWAGDPQRLHDYIYALTQHLAVNRVTSIMTLETAANAERLPFGSISYMADNLIVLDLAGDQTIRRTIRVLKTRGSAHDPRVREMEIQPTAIRIR
jgi:circadian clock protein KaiC